MKLTCLAFFLTLFGLEAGAQITQRRVELENQLQQRISSIVERADPLAMVQVRINLRKINSELPGMGMNAQVVPVEYDGQLGASSIASVEVRVLTQIDDMPQWIRQEVEKAVGVSDGRKLNIVYEKAAGTITDHRLEFGKIAKEATQSAVKSINQLKWGIWGMLLALGVVGYGIFGFARRLEKAMVQLIEEKILPAMQQGTATRAMLEKGSGPSEDVVQVNGGGAGATVAGASFSDYPQEALLTLLSDCYWTAADGYAHYLWLQMSERQKEAVLASQEIDSSYFTAIRQSLPVNLDYHNDARYYMFGKEFRGASQADVLEWLNKNPKQFYRITPLRWDLLPLSLEQRIQFAATKFEHGEVSTAPMKISIKSKPRLLVNRLQLKALRAEDEQFAWNHPDKIPAEIRPSIRSLVWLAMASEDDRRRILGELDAQQLASAWTGPLAALERLKEVLPPKKIEMLDHFLQSAVPDRTSAAFAYLVDSGLNLMKDEPEKQQEAA